MTDRHVPVPPDSSSGDALETQPDNLRDFDPADPANPPAAKPKVRPASRLQLEEADSRGMHTIWGLTPEMIHRRYWASLGIAIIRVGERTKIDPKAELYLLLDPHTMPLFPLEEAMKVLKWVEPTLLTLRLQERRNDGYRESVVLDPSASGGERFRRFERIYDGADMHMARAALTPDREIANMWRGAKNPLDAWSRVRKYIMPDDRATLSIDARVYDRVDDREVALMIRDLVMHWRRPDATIKRAMKCDHAEALGVESSANGSRLGRLFDRTQPHAEVWHDPTAQLQNVQFLDRVWVGAGRTFEAGTTVVGPRVVWDDPAKRPSHDEVGQIDWDDIAPLPLAASPRRKVRLSAEDRKAIHNGTTASKRANGSMTAGPQERQTVPDTIVYSKPGALAEAGKRAFDLAFSTAALGMTAPLWPVILFMIWKEDGRPFFFGHTRQTLGHRNFTCWKFRSMSNNADAITAELRAKGGNHVDGPQFHIDPDEDPRITRIGKFLRKTNLDELPQFWNVIRGDMSVVGPRPSPDNENQFNPVWREARLSVRPGITGLWQLRRTRDPDEDFREWVKWDLQYVQTRSFWGDISIIFKTAAMIFRKIARS